MGHSFLATKKLTFSATTHDLYVKILGSADGGASFSETEVSDVSITTASPVTIQVDEYYYALKVQVKPATANQHGTITVKAMGVSIPSSATSTLDTIDSKLPPLVNGKVPVDASVSVDAIDIGNVDISEFPAENLGQKPKASSLSVAPATDIADPTYIGDIRFGESLPAGTNIIGEVGIDQTTQGTTNGVVVKSSALPTGAATSALQLKKPQTHVNIDFSSASDQIIIAAPGTGKRIWLTRLSLSSGGAQPVNVEIAIKSGATTIETQKGSAMVFDYPEHRNLGENEAFVLQATTADRVIGGVDYYVEAV